jgi:ribosomal protein L11 methyltransferase
VSVLVPAAAAEVARARMLELFPQGFEEADTAEGVELVTYTTAAGEDRLRSAFGGVASVPVSPDWADRWREFHVPVLVGPLWIGPPWKPPPPGVVPIVIDPGRAFGTGAHPTTRLCLELLGDVKPGSLVDIGCGSGVLAIAAAKLGFGRVFALDNDRAAVEAARANAARNGVEIAVREADAREEALPEAEIAVANLSLRAIELLADRVAPRLLIASGYLEGEHPRLPRFVRRERRTVEGWAADVFERVAECGATIAP